MFACSIQLARPKTKHTCPLGKWSSTRLPDLPALFQRTLHSPGHKLCQDCQQRNCLQNQGTYLRLQDWTPIADYEFRSPKHKSSRPELGVQNAKYESQTDIILRGHSLEPRGPRPLWVVPARGTVWNPEGPVMCGSRRLIVLQNWVPGYIRIYIYIYIHMYI